MGFFKFSKKKKGQTSLLCNKQGARLYTIKEAGHYLGRTDWGIRDLIHKGVLPFITEDGSKKWFIDVRDLDEFVDSRKEYFE